MKKQTISLKMRALSYLAKREYSQYELKKKLSRYLDDSQNKDDIERLIIDLEKDNWLNNERFAESLIRRRQSKRGNAQIVMELRQHQLTPDLIKEKLSVFQDNEYERAYAVWQKKFGHINVELNSLFDVPKANTQTTDYHSASEQNNNLLKSEVSISLPIHRDNENEINQLQTRCFPSRKKSLQSKWLTSSTKTFMEDEENSEFFCDSSNRKQNERLNAGELLNKQRRFLASRGFSAEIIRQVLSTVTEKKSE